jgi:hypothetical protein
LMTLLLQYLHITLNKVPNQHQSFQHVNHNWTSFGLLSLSTNHWSLVLPSQQQHHPELPTISHQKTTSQIFPICVLFITYEYSRWFQQGINTTRFNHRPQPTASGLVSSCKCLLWKL